MVRQKKQVVVDGQVENREWVVDVSALKSVRGNDWVEDFPQLLKTDLEQMAKTFPHWFLTVGYDVNPISCPDDNDYFVPQDGQLRCVNCGQVIKKTPACLIWTGLLPVQIIGGGKVERHVKSLIGKGEIRLPYVGSESIFILAPIKIVYPTNWPNSQPYAYYTREFFHSLGVSAPGVSHANHMNGDLKMCLFLNWHRMTILEVIQNRIAPHALAQVKIANGERPNSRWFNS